jgi:pSer/pThr/pTyr-binding forkhead associated (FHA) protein
MLIQNVPANGIKLGRGHECEIRIADISVSRNHAYIKMIGSSFYIFDSNSKFGTLVRSEAMSFELGKNSRVIQIGRTMLIMEIRKDNYK